MSFSGEDGRRFGEREGESEQMLADVALIKLININNFKDKLQVRHSLAEFPALFSSSLQ